MELMQWLTDSDAGRFLFTALVSMIPVVELRGGIPFGVAALGLPPWAAFFAAVIGNMIPLPFIVVYIRRIFQWMRRHLPRLDRLVDTLETKAHLKGRKVTRYKYIIYTFFFIFFSITVYYGILAVVPCALLRALFFWSM